MFRKYFSIFFSQYHEKKTLKPLSNKKCMTQSNEYAQGLNYYSFAVNLDRCVGVCNTINNLYNKLCVPNKTADLNIHVFNIRGIMISVSVSVKISNM